LFAAAAALALAAACGSTGGSTPAFEDRVLPGEDHLSSVRQLTFGGQNAEAYWSFDNRHLIFQSTREGAEGNAAQCDQIFIMEVETGEVTQITSKGRTTCAYFLPDDEHVLYASTHEASPDCPPEPDRSMGYVWPLYDGYEIYVAKRDGTGLRNITNSPGYDAEATVSRDGRIIFTSTRSGDLELWSMDADGGDLKQLTDTPGYDGGAFFSPDGSKIVWRASRFDDPAEEQEYFRLLGEGLVRPSKLEIFVADADGSNVVQVTRNGRANFAPFFTPDGDSVLFSSNMADEQGRIFDIWKVGLDGEGIERVTWNDSFDGFPMFSWDGRRLAFASNRFNGAPYDTNVFVADWLR
jgi:Tol biopolymer transport system component